MSRAKSRLKTRKKRRHKHRLKLKLPSFKRCKNIKKIVRAYRQQLPTLTVGLAFAAATYWLITTINPIQIKHIILPNTYLPLLLLAFLTIFFLASFVWLNSRRGLITAIITICFLFLQLQQVIITNTITIAIIGPLVLLELILSFIKSRS